ncbi:MAG: DUF427 domain-containing protein [Thermoleophilaceae bacterium]|nr:DUF427 domain-containing protein [Thermoleophilaceae bacterium]
MALTLGTGPFGERPAGEFNFDAPRADVSYVEDSPRWIRVRLGGETVADSRRMKMLHRSGKLPVYLFPPEDVRRELIPEDAVREHGRLLELDFHAMDEWLEEDEQLFGHARDPYHRIDTRRTSRAVRVSIGGRTVAETTRATVLFETGLPPRWYIPREDIRAELEPSDHRTACAYKGHATHFTAAGEEAVAWSYEDPLLDAAPVKDLVAFYDERVDLEIDGEPQERPRTPWSR